jgi:RNA polymerase sigma-70 factor, ECF subfamily
MNTVNRMRDRDVSLDMETMVAFGRRDPAAARELYDRYASRIYGLGIVMLGNAASAEDLVQDTFVKLWRGSDRFDAERGSLDSYVLLIARSLAIDTMRRRVAVAHEDASELLDRRPSTERGPEESAEMADQVERARRALEDLAPEQRAALELVYFGGRTAAQIAELEDIPLGTAKTRIRAGLLRLRDALGDTT